MSITGLHLSGSAHIGAARLFGPVTLDAPAGAWTCLLGPSGVGKSSILRLLAGLGEGVVFDGRLGADDGQPLTGRVALMAQGDLLLPWLDLVGNVTLGARLRGAPADKMRAAELLRRVGLAAHTSKRPDALSGGQRQRVALARTLMEDRPVVLLDEPFSALDARARAQMQDLAAALLAGRTVLHVTHDTLEAARLGEQVLLMTEQGMRSIAPPAAPAPRPHDACETLVFQGHLQRLLMMPA
ncbi:ATP-binding cassette domain-containing protein [Salipiger sp. 1_MG-2023]|uniref:ABC transporter ATP-binding protein n=1 Tax=Salipiger sp. 1_MG-2023 TaxID=3062665 RepID=UPI0026E2AC61|nr:ATP-binding cassette domain-containing protein [Salipiger sp. 1_MG-2023]MDO6587203.1 ATP-binding cassette domain-containing protein [Salipiger sp. 1_MG-2023]